MKISQYLKNILTKTLIILDLIVNYIVYVPKFWCRIQYFGYAFLSEIILNLSSHLIGEIHTHLCLKS